MGILRRQTGLPTSCSGVLIRACRLFEEVSAPHLCEPVPLSPHDPDQYKTDHGGYDAGNTQRSFRALDCGCRQPFCRRRKSGEKQSLDDKYETDRNEELGHTGILPGR